MKLKPKTLTNTFEVDNETMTIDQEAYIADIEEFGLFTYEEFAEMFWLPQEIFDSFNLQYMKISVGKGLFDYDSLGKLIATYSSFWTE